MSNQDAPDPAAVMAAHRHHNGGCYWSMNGGSCEPYRLAEALAAEQAKVAEAVRLAENWHSIARDRRDRVQAAVILRALADQPEQDV